MSDRWFFRQRQAWIGETVHIFGFINREHIQRKFEISTPQASVDIQHFIDANPGAPDLQQVGEAVRGLILTVVEPTGR